MLLIVAAIEIAGVAQNRKKALYFYCGASSKNWKN